MVRVWYWWTVVKASEAVNRDRDRDSDSDDISRFIFMVGNEAGRVLCVYYLLFVDVRCLVLFVVFVDVLGCVVVWDSP